MFNSPTPSATASDAARPATSELREVILQYQADRQALERRYDARWCPERRARFRAFFAGWRERLEAVPFASLGQEGRIDYLLLSRRLPYELHLLEREERLFAEMAGLLPFAARVLDLHAARRRMETPEPAAAAESLARIPEEVSAARTEGERERPAPRVAARAAEAAGDLLGILEKWHSFYSGYDPLFTWWTAAPYAAAKEALEQHRRFLREDLLGLAEGDEEPVLGEPIGAEGLAADLELELIPYSAAELLQIGRREMAWCEREGEAIAWEMGFPDWKAALEHIKGLHVPPGGQPDLVRDLALEAIGFLEARDLVTIPALAKEVWRMEMMSPEAQRVNPFFLGGEVIQVSFPTDGMSHAEKRMSLRGNNRHFARATVQHELIPGHHLQGFMLERHQPHRRAFTTCFWIEGWALHWEFLLWELGFPATPEDRAGMLFWRMHRAARILFSLAFHLGEMSPEEAVALLVERVGHEPANAAAEVRRSLKGDYPPLYQAAYMLGGLQFRALYRETVSAGRMTPRQFHDAVLEGGPMPVELVRARLLGLPLAADYRASWRFADGEGAE